MRLDDCSPGVGYQLPVHAVGNDVSTSVVAPHEGGVDALDVRRQTGVGQRPPGYRIPLSAGQLPVAGTCNTISSAVAERLRDVSCHEIYC